MTKERIAAALREKARILYEGKAVPHRSCGIALAETFGRATGPYQALRRGGVTGKGQCGAVVAGQLVLGELFGHADPTAPVSLPLREAMMRYFAEVDVALRPEAGAPWICNDMVVRFPSFQSKERADYCTDVVTTVAGIVARIALDLGAPLEAPGA